MEPRRSHHIHSFIVKIRELLEKLKISTSYSRHRPMWGLSPWTKHKLISTR